MSAHYAEAFTLSPGRCFRMVTDPEPRRRGQPAHCEQPVVSRGSFGTAGSAVYRVDACAIHRDDLTHRRAVNPPG